jgi:hypothetical protein
MAIAVPSLTHPTPAPPAPRFKHEEDAAQAFDCSALLLYGPAAAVNFGAERAERHLARFFSDPDHAKAFKNIEQLSRRRAEPRSRAPVPPRLVMRVGTKNRRSGARRPAAATATAANNYEVVPNPEFVAASEDTVPEAAASSEAADASAGNNGTLAEPAASAAGAAPAPGEPAASAAGDATGVDAAREEQLKPASEETERKSCAREFVAAAFTHKAAPSLPAEPATPPADAASEESDTGVWPPAGRPAAQPTKPPAADTSAASLAAAGAMLRPRHSTAAHTAAPNTELSRVGPKKRARRASAASAKSKAKAARMTPDPEAAAVARPLFSNDASKMAMVCNAWLESFSVAAPSVSAKGPAPLGWGACKPAPLVVPAAAPAGALMGASPMLGLVPNLASAETYSAFTNQPMGFASPPVVSFGLVPPQLAYGPSGAGAMVPPGMVPQPLPHPAQYCAPAFALPVPPPPAPGTATSLAPLPATQEAEDENTCLLSQSDLAMLEACFPPVPEVAPCCADASDLLILAPNCGGGESEAAAYLDPWGDPGHEARAWGALCA